MMAGNVLGKGYTAGVGMTIGTAFGRIAGTQAALAGIARMRRPCNSLKPTRDASRLRMAFCSDGRNSMAARQLIPIQLSANEAEVARQMQICNACRYCEGFCAVFPAMTRRLEFGKADIHYLANLCHNCGACLHACQYAPPHEFAVNVPQAMAAVRGQTYTDYAWPPAAGRAVPAQRLDAGAGAGGRLGAVPLMLARGTSTARCGAAVVPLAAASTRCSRTT